VVAVYWRAVDVPRPEVHYPYVCMECKEVVDISELQKDPKNWRSKSAALDSVVKCIRCNEGWAYPVTPCQKCGTKFIRHLIIPAKSSDNPCPKCNPAVAAAAKEKGVELIWERD